jgi:hypothetical protein
VFLATGVLCGADCFARETWFHQRVTWNYGKDGQAWNTTIKNANGTAEYRLVLQPLWAVEGGVVALEIVVARPAQPDVNMLGKRESDTEYPFVITVEELERGLAQSRFGAVRRLQADDVALKIKVERFRLGRGLGDCPSCGNLQELSIWITVEGKTKQTK